MAREPIIRGDDDDDDRPAKRGAGKQPPAPRPTEDKERDDELRPQRLEDVVGQRSVVDRLRIMLNAARKRSEPLGHLLLDGPPGLGKTTFATVIPRELGVDVQLTSAPSSPPPRICSPI